MDTNRAGVGGGVWAADPRRDGGRLGDGDARHAAQSSAGGRTFKIIPAPFPDPTEIGLGGEGAVIALNVLPPAASEPTGDAARQFLPAVAAPQASADPAPTNSRNGVWIATAGVLVRALGLTVLAQRGGLRRRSAK